MNQADQSTGGVGVRRPWSGGLGVLGVVLAAWVGGDAWAALPVPDGPPTWGDVLRASAGATTVQMEVVHWVHPEDEDHYESARGTVTVRWPDAVRMDMTEPAREHRPEKRWRLVATPEGSAVWGLDDGSVQRTTGRARFDEVMQEQSLYLALLGMPVVPGADGLVSLPLGPDLELETNRRSEPQAGGLRVFRVPRGDMSNGLQSSLAISTAYLFDADDNELEGFGYAVGYFSSAGIQAKVSFDPRIGPDTFSLTDPAGGVWVENPTWAGVRTQIDAARRVRITCNERIVPEDGVRAESRTRQITLSPRGLDEPIREDVWAPARRGGLAEHWRKVSTRDGWVRWDLTRRTVQRAQGEGVLEVARYPHADDLEVFGIPVTEKGDVLKVWRVDDDAVFTPVAGRHPDDPTLRGYELDGRVTRRWPRANTYWFTADGRTLRRATQEANGTSFDRRIQLEPRLPDDFFSTVDPTNGGAWGVTPTWEDVVRAGRNASAVRVMTSVFDRPGADAPYALTYRQAHTARWPDEIRLDVYPAPTPGPTPEGKAIREMYIATPTWSLDQKDDGKPGWIYESRTRLDELWPRVARVVGEVGLTLTPGAADAAWVEPPARARMLELGLVHPVDPTLRAFRFGGAKGTGLADVFWFDQSGRRLAGVSSSVRRSGDRLIYRAVEFDPVLSKSFFERERQCGDWSD